MLTKIDEKVGKFKFQKTVQSIDKTKKIENIHSPNLVIVSLVYHDAINMALLALKSFQQQFPYGRFELIDDGSLLDEDYELLHRHLCELTIINISSIDTEKCPKGNCWERLVHIIHLSQQNYVIQVDTDTFTNAAIPEVWDAYKANRAFSIAGPIWQQPVDLNYMASIASGWNSEHIQTLAESQLNRLKLNLGGYVRGCAAFQGFPKGEISITDLADLTFQMEELLGKERWNEWGSEQFASNVMISLARNIDVLPWPKYQNFGFPFVTSPKELESYIGKVSLIHFIGSHRFKYGIFEKLARRYLSSAV